MTLRTAPPNNITRGVSSENTFGLLPSDHLCDDEIRECLNVVDDSLLYLDRDHLNKNGSMYLTHMFVDQLLDFISK